MSKQTDLEKYKSLPRKLTVKKKLKVFEAIGFFLVFLIFIFAFSGCFVIDTNPNSNLVSIFFILTIVFIFIFGGIVCEIEKLRDIIKKSKR